jgi:hypothetical protein
MINDKEGSRHAKGREHRDDRQEAALMLESCKKAQSAAA